MIVGLWIWLQGTGELKRKDLDRMAVALLLHDVGMCKVPPFLLSKAGPLKQEEREKNYQTVIENLTEKFQILNQVQNDLKEIKDNLLNKN